MVVVRKRPIAILVLPALSGLSLVIQLAAPLSIFQRFPQYQFPHVPTAAIDRAYGHRLFRGSVLAGMGALRLEEAFGILPAMLVGSAL
jgi:hypothetical protein